MHQGMRELRVLACVFTCCPPGKPGFTGGEDILGWNFLQQISRFHQVWALTQAQDRASIEDALAEDPRPNLHPCYVALPWWLRPLLRIQGGHQFYYFLWQIRAYFAARSLHKQCQFDLFHHITYANDWMVSYIGAFLPVPYVRGPGGGAHRTPKGLAGEYSWPGRTWEKVRSIGQWLFRHDPVFIRSQKRARAILVCNRESKDSIPAKWAHKTVLFPACGVTFRDLVQFTGEGADGAQFRVLSAGSLIRVKGFSLAIKAFKKFSDHYPRSHLSIIGSGPERPRLQSLITQLCLEGNVSLVHWMARDRLLSEMARSHVFLFPSLRDGGATVVVEAMAAGIPVVCLDIGGPGMHVTEESGIKVTPRSSSEEAVLELADALERLYMDERLRQTMGKAAREIARETYLWDHLGERLVGIYQDALEAKAAG